MNCVFDNNVLLLCPITMFTCSVTCNSFRKLIWCTNCFGFEIFVLIIRVLFDYSYIDPACQYIWCRYGIVYQTTDVEMFICTRDTKHCLKGLVTKVIYHFKLLHLYIVRYTGTVTAATTQQPIPDTTTSSTTTIVTTIRDSTAVFVTTTSPATATSNATYSAINNSKWDLWIWFNNHS